MSPTSNGSATAVSIRKTQSSEGVIMEALGTLLLLASGTCMIAGAILVSAFTAVQAMEHARGDALFGYAIASALGNAAIVLLVIAGGRL